MIKRGLLLVLLLITAINLTNATDFNGYKFPGDKFTLNGDNFTLQISQSWETLYLKYNKESLILEENTCDFTDLKYYLICFDKAYVDFVANPELGKLDDRTGDIIPSINISIRYRKPDIKMTRTFSKIDPLLNEIIKVDVSIENNGKNPAQIDFLDVIPDGLKATPGDNVAYDGKNIIYRTHVAMGAKKIFFYQLRPTNFDGGVISGNLSYVYEDFSGLIKNEDKTISIKNNVKLDVTSPASLGVQETSQIIIMLTNIDPSDGSSVNIWFSVPDVLTIKSISPQPQKEGEYNYSFFIPKEESKTIKLDIKTTVTGQYIIPVFYEFEIYGIRKRIEKNITFDVISDKVDPELILPTEKIGSDQNFNIKAKLVNKDTDTIYYNIIVNLKSQFLTETISIPKIVQNQDLLILSKDVIAPTMEEKTDFDIVLNGSYYTAENEMFEFSLKKKMTVYPPKDTIVIYHEFDKYFNETDKASIHVYVENTREKRISNVEIKDIIPPDFKIIEGKTETKTVLEPKRKAKVYDYIVQSIIQNKSANNIVTSVRFNETDKEFIVKQTLSLDIIGKSTTKKEIITELENASFDIKQDIQVDEKPAQATSSQGSSSQPVIQEMPAKKSFLDKIKDFFRNLFK